MKSKVSRFSLLIQSSFFVALILCLSTLAVSQTKPVPQPDEEFRKVLEKYPGLLPELGQLIEKLHREVQLPETRPQSALLPLLPSSTTYYAAFPNYGETVHQVLTTFQDQLKVSPALRSWLQQGDMPKTVPQVESFLEKFYGLSQYLGDEIVISGDTKESNHDPLIIAQARKPGLKNFLLQALQDLPEKSRQNLRILEPTELASARSQAKAGEFVVLVRPDFIVASTDLKAVRTFNHTLDAKGGEFASVPFGQRLTQAYQSGTSVVAGGDLHTILSQMPIPTATPANERMLQRSGFRDMKYLVWNTKTISGHSLSETELSFMGPRRGMAAWLAAPQHLGSLEFVSPRAMLTFTLVLKNFGEIFDDLKEFSSDSNPNAFATLPQMEQALHVNLRNDLLSQLQGEITFELRGISGQQPAWAAVLKVNDSDRLQATLDRLLSNMPLQSNQFEEAGIVYHSLMVPSRQKPTQISYALTDGYLVIASSHESAAEAIQFHRSGESLAKSKAFLAALPPGSPLEASGMLYEDAAAMAGMQLRHLTPEMEKAFANLTPGGLPVVFTAYGENTAIRTVSASGGADPTVILIGAAIAIPNLLRARIEANEASAVATLRTINAAQITYASAYPQKGYARDLATLGPDPARPTSYSADHAGLIDAELGSKTCTAGVWCTKSGYRFTIRPVCKLNTCSGYVAVGSPVATSGSRNFCSTADGVIRSNPGPALQSPITASECRMWSPIR